MRALITGGTGFAGKYLSKYLKLLGYETAVTELNESNCNEDKVYKLNILDISNISSVIEDFKPDVIFHLAAQSSVSLSWSNPETTIDVNIKGTLNILEVLKKINYQGCLLLVGSSEEYGFTDYSRPVNEETILKPGNIYAATKVMQEMLGSIYFKGYGLNVIMTRSFNHIGAGQSPQFVVSDFAKQVAEIEKGLREPVIYVGNLNSERDFTDVRDIVKGYVLLSEKGKYGEIYNIGSGKSIKISDILNRLLEMSSCEIKVEVDKNKFRPVDIPVIKADISKMYTDTGWLPEIDINNSLEEVLNYWRKIV